MKVGGTAVIEPGGVDFTFLEPCPCDGLIIQGSADTVVAPEGVTKLVERLNRKKHDVAYEIIEGAGHFFENEMETLQGHVDRYLAKRLASA